MSLYTRVFNAINGSVARSKPVKDEFDRIQAAFASVEENTDAALRGQAGEVVDRYPAAATRANKSAGFDSFGQPTVFTAATSEEMTAAVLAASSASVSAAAAAASAASLSGVTAAVSLFQLDLGLQ